MTAAPLCEAAVVMADTAAPATSAPDVAPAQEKQAATAAASAMSEKGEAAPVTARDAQASVASPAPDTGGGPSGSPTADASTTAVATTSGQAGSAGTANGATAAATGGSTANVSSKLNVKTKSKLALNPEASVFTPTSSPARVSPARSNAFPASWAPPAVVLANSGLRPPAGVSAGALQHPAAAGQPGDNGGAAAAQGTSKSSSRRRKRRGRKRGASVDGDPKMVKLTGMGSGGDIPALRGLISQLFGPVSAVTSAEPSPGQLVAFVTFATAEHAESAVRAGGLNHNGSKLKFSRTYVAGGGVGTAPTNVVRLSNLPTDLTAEALAKILAKHGARASAADMQRNPDGSFTGVVLCRYCSNDAAARAVNQLSKAVADGRALVAEYNLPPGAPGGGPTNAASPAPVAARAPARGSPVHRLVPAVPAVTPQALSRTSQRRRSRGYSEDWTSRRSSEVGSASKPARYRKGSFHGSPLQERPAGMSALPNTWRERRARSLSGCGSAPPVPVHYARGPDGSVGFELVRRGRSRSIAEGAR